MTGDTSSKIHLAQNSKITSSELTQQLFPHSNDNFNISDNFAEQFFGRFELRKDGPNILEEKARRRKE